MKHLKYFETQTQKYKKGDYILVDIPLMKYIDANRNIPNDMIPSPEETQKFWNSKSPLARIYLVMDRNYSPYRLRFSDDSIYDIDIRCIKRYLNQEEIDEYEAKITSLKYNL